MAVPSFRSFLLQSVTLATICSPLAAQESYIVGARAGGMGGAQVASVRDFTAQYYNPAAFGFMSHSGETYEENLDNNKVGDRDFGLGVNVNVGLRIRGKLADLIEQVDDIDIDRISDINNPLNLTDNDINDILDLASVLAQIDDEDNVIMVNGTASAGIRIGHFGVGLVNHGSVIGLVSDVDLDNLGLTLDGAEFSQSVTDNRAALGAPPQGTHTNQYLTGTIEQNLITNGGLTAEAIEVLDYLITEQVNNGTLPADGINRVVDVLETVGVSSGDLDDNLTRVVFSGYYASEIPVSYGYRINNNWSVGANFKYILGTVVGTSVRIFDDDAEDNISDALDNTNQTSTFGLDVSAIYRIPNFQFGAIARNINSPKFDGFVDSFGITIPDVTLDPQVTVGAAWIPSHRLTLEANVDAIGSETVATNYDYQRASVGVEFDLSVVQLRGGLTTNIAESDIGPMLTGGLGLNLWLLRIELAGGVALDTIEVEGDEYPKEAYVGLQLSSQF